MNAIVEIGSNFVSKFLKISLYLVLKRGISYDNYFSMLNAMIQIWWICFEILLKNKKMHVIFKTIPKFLSLFRWYTLYKRYTNLDTLWHTFLCHVCQHFNVLILHVLILFISVTDVLILCPHYVALHSDILQNEDIMSLFCFKG